MSWQRGRRSRLTALGLPPAIKAQLIREKARSGQTIVEQVVAALMARWQSQGVMEVSPVQDVPARYYTPPSIYPPRPPAVVVQEPQVFQGVSVPRPDAYISQAQAPAGTYVPPPGVPVRVGCPQPPGSPQAAEFAVVRSGRFAGMVRQRVPRGEDPNPPWQ